MHQPLKLIRISSLEQLQQLADLASRAFADDAIFQWLDPGRHEHPDDFRRFWYLILRDEFSQPGTVFLAACGDGCDDLRNALGFGVWRRHGNSETARSWQGDSLRKRLMRVAVLLEYLCRIATGRLSLGTILALLSSIHDVEKHYPTERWRLSWLGVSPDFQRSGVGKVLLQWGLSRSEEEGVPAVLESSKPGRGLYLKLGFEEIGWMKFDGGKQQQPIMLRSPHEHKKTP